MGITNQQRATWAMRGKMVSPGRPPIWQRDQAQQFWIGIAKGLSSEDAAIAVGVSSPVGSKWFRHAGGMRPISLAPLSGRYLSFAEREEIAILKAKGCGVREIARQLKRSPSTISRELRRNAATRTDSSGYRASNAQWHANRRAKRPKVAKLAANEPLRAYVEDRLSGQITRPDGTAVPGPTVRFKGRRHGPRQDRRWAKAWSPEQISNRLRVDFPNDESMRISHEAIYQALFIQGRGALRRELMTCLRTGRALRVPRARTQGHGKNFVTPEVMISERPAEAEDRAVPGHWEGDLIIGLNKSAIGTLVERTSRFTMLLHLPPMEGHGTIEPTKNGPPLAGHGAEAVRDAIATSFSSLPEQLRRSLTWDQGAELAQHVKLRIDTGLAIYFCDPHSPWRRGTNENTNGLLRQYFPKGTDLTRHGPDELAAVATALNADPERPSNGRPRQRRSSSSCNRPDQVVLLRPLEPNQYTSIAYTEPLSDVGAAPSIGTIGESFVNAMAESVMGLFKTELHRNPAALAANGGPWKGLDDLEAATCAWVSRFNEERLHSELDDMTPAEVEAEYRRKSRAAAA